MFLPANFPAQIQWSLPPITQKELSGLSFYNLISSSKGKEICKEMAQVLIQKYIKEVKNVIFSINFWIKRRKEKRKWMNEWMNERMITPLDRCNKQFSKGKMPIILKFWWSVSFQGSTFLFGELIVDNLTTLTPPSSVSKAVELLQRAKEAPGDRETALRDSLKLFLKAPKFIQLNMLKTVCKDYQELGYYHGIIELVFACSQEIDPFSTGIHFYRDGCPDLVSLFSWAWLFHLRLLIA